MPGKKAFVIDASALGKRLRDEPQSPALNDWLDERLQHNDDLLAIPFLRYEVGNILVKLVKEGVIDLDPMERERRIGIAMLGIRSADAKQASRFAPPLSYYDAGYLALAHATGATLVTYDKELAAAARDNGVEVVAPGE